MSERDAKLWRLASFGPTAIVGYLGAIVRSLQGFQESAWIFLLGAIIATIICLFTYRSYIRLRRARWQEELKASEEKMQQMLAEEVEKAKRET
jgi:flagellar biosynthesis/type III secretory pathway M-ring protein FliF/YscJ